MSLSSVLEENRNKIEDRFDEALHKSGRKRGDVTLIAVSKKQPDERISYFIKNPCGKYGRSIDGFGENRVLEAKERWQSRLKSEYESSDKLTPLHMIGRLQSNKVATAVELFDFIHSVDSIKLSKKIAEEQKKQNKRLTLFVQINTGREEQKGGVLPEKLYDFISQSYDDFGIKFSGLMCIPPIGDSPEKHFSMLANLSEKYDLPLLSMGMSSDFEQAIKCGATHIRIGSALFGSR